MKKPYTRKSSEEGLEQEFNSLQAQREACEAFITSQRHEGWSRLPGTDNGSCSALVKPDPNSKIYRTRNPEKADFGVSRRARAS